jgi:Protein of unknown function (DUF1573)
MRSVLLSWAVLTALALTSANVARAQSWVDSILPERSFDAGNVAKGSKVRHTFPVVNRLNQPIHIASYKPKCGCTKVEIGAYDVPPGTQTTIAAVIDTTNFQGYKPSGLTLVIDRPYYAEIDLNFSCYIRTDLVMNPGAVDFGIVTRASSPKPTVTMLLTYAGGQPNWGITRMQTRGAHVSAKLQEQNRSADGRVEYRLTATLDPSDLTGYFKDEISLYTNDSANGQPIPVAVSAVVQTSVSVSPSPLVLGSVKAGQELKRVLLVRGAQPFKLGTVHANRDEVNAAPDSEESKAAHTVNLTLKVPAQPGPFNSTITIETDVKGEPPLKVNTFATVIP